MKILQVCVELDGGGIDRYLLNYCSRIRDIEFDFVIVDDDSGKRGILEPLIEALGSHIYRVPRQTGHMRENYSALKKIMTDTKYDAVHVHLGYKGAVALLCAKRCGIKTRIVHAHIAYEQETAKQKMVRKLFTVISKHYATSLFACGVDAAKWVWGESTYKKGKVSVINNAIDARRYAYSVDTRSRVRSDFGIEENMLVVGHVGRLCSQKNQLRLLDIFKEIKTNVDKSLLLLVGRGNLEDEIKTKITSLGLDECVRLLGVRDDVPDLLSALDVFVFPSLYEGLPFTLVETQCNGLYALSADTVTKLAKVGNCVEFMSLDESDKSWAQRAVKLSEQGHKADEWENIVINGYDIDTEANKLRDRYYDLVKASAVDE